MQEVETRPKADCGSDHELLIAKSRLKLKKVGKTTRPVRYYLNQIPYDYTVEVTNKFTGLDLINRVREELWMKVHDIVQEAVIKTILKKQKCTKARLLSEEALQIAEKRAYRLLKLNHLSSQSLSFLSRERRIIVLKIKRNNFY